MSRTYFSYTEKIFFSVFIAILVLSGFVTQSVSNKEKTLLQSQDGTEISLAEGLVDEESLGQGASIEQISVLVEEYIPLRYKTHTVVKGDMIGGIAKENSLNQDTLISINDIKNSRLLRIGQTLRIPNQDGILYTVKARDTNIAIAEKFSINLDAILAVNETPEKHLYKADEVIFLPGARLSATVVQEINGDLFLWPVRGGRLTSYYGYRNDPFTGRRQFHNGLDIASPPGTPIRAAMAGRVSASGYDAISGNYVILTHHSGYRSFYGHMQTVRVKTGQQVALGARIGDVGSTGYSTGSHVHFSVYKYGRTVNPLFLLHN